MTRWQQVRELFDETVALEPRDRDRVLRERAGADRELMRAVEALVVADAAAAPEFDRTATELLEQIGEVPRPDELCGVSFGAYRIEQHIASGGMAHVYRATRSIAGTDRRVAIKVLREGLDTEALLARFQRERQMLAALEHEHIVAFLDAGALPDGRPFLAMEFVDGVPLTTWAEARPLRERLRLFLQVLATVEYAHSQLVVHRDLKPSNVLVTPQGVPKLLDFGVASLLEAECGQAIGIGPLTPVYASPEQLAGADVGTASDVYSLGVLLCETVAGGLRDDAVTGDLGYIVAKARAAHPHHRYRSASELAGDLRRLLASEPISARPGSWAYRSRLFAKRHRWPILLAAATSLALALGWISAELGRQSARQDASFGWGAHGQAKAVARLYDRWITAAAGADPQLAARATASLEQALRDDFATLPEAETLVRMTLARIYLDLGDRQRARQHAERAWQLAQSTRGVGQADRDRAAALVQVTAQEG